MPEIFLVVTYVGTTAIKIGISTEFAFYLVAIANAGSMFGRFFAGFLGDKIGPLNVMIPFTAVAGLLTYAWPFIKTEVVLLGVTVAYGYVNPTLSATTPSLNTTYLDCSFSSGAYISLLSNPMMEMGGTDDVGMRVGMFMTILALGALAGPPISGAIADKAVGGFIAVGIFAGTSVLVGVGLMCLTRHLVLKPGFHKA